VKSKSNKAEVKRRIAVAAICGVLLYVGLMVVMPEDCTRDWNPLTCGDCYTKIVCPLN